MFLRRTVFLWAFEIGLSLLFATSTPPAKADDKILYRKEAAALAQARRSPSFGNLRRLSDIRFRIAKSLAAEAHDDTNRAAFRGFLLHADSAARLHPGASGEHWILLGYGLLRIAEAPHALETAEDAFRAALRVTPWSERALAGLALTLFAQKRYSEARAQWDALFDALPEAVTGSRLVAYEASAVAADELREGYEALTRLTPRLGEQDGVNEVRHHFCQYLYVSSGQSKWRDCAIASEATKK